MSENIQVVVRCRARSQHEVIAKSPNIIELHNDTFSANQPFVNVLGDQVSSILSHRQSNGSNTGPMKVYKVDQVYGPSADQQILFNNVAIPLFNDFINGLNVTILAYGQTGSGKTHTMCGDLSGDNAGIIPRILSKLFDSKDTDTMVKLSCVELYKEELNDLINTELDLMPVKQKLRLFSDSNDRSFPSSPKILNLTEVHIDSSEMGFKILQKCLRSRRTGTTKMNDLSSRSHTIFSILLYKEVKNDSDVPTFTVSKMNLVDLAGLEDINKSGAINERAREAGSINQSLLTLGKVINSLSEGKENKHVPYRESKLTRLLQGSLGGKTKTALIATISPAKINLQETISTLNYASKAKNIKNIPQSVSESELLTKRILVSDMSAHIARLTRDLLASKDKDDGIKISLSNYDEYTSNLQCVQADLKEKTSQIAGLNGKLDAKNEEIQKLQAQLSKAEKSSQELLKTYTSRLSELESQLSSLHKKHALQSEKVNEVLENNMSQATQLLAHTLNELRSEKSRLHLDLEGSKSSIIQELSTFQSKIVDGAEKLKSLLDLGHKINAVLDSNMLSSLPTLLTSFDIASESKALENQKERFFREIDQAIEPSLFKEQTDRKIESIVADSNLFKEKLLAELSSTIGTMLDTNRKDMEDNLRSMTLDVIEESRSKIDGKKEILENGFQELLVSLDEKTTKFRKCVKDAEREQDENLAKARKSLQNHVISAIENVDQFKKTSASIASESSTLVKDKLDTVEATIRGSGSVVGENLEVISGDIRRLNESIRKIGESTILNSTNLDSTNLDSRIWDSKLKRTAENSIALSSPAKRRRPMSPLINENGMSFSRIPQLHKK